MITKTIFDKKLMFSKFKKMYYNNQTTEAKNTKGEILLNFIYIAASVGLAGFTVFCALS